MRLIRGNLGKRKPAGRGAPILRDKLRDPPDWMVDSQREIWSAALASAPPRSLRRLKDSAFTIWVVACDLYNKATIKLGQTGLLVKAPKGGGPQQNPYMPIVNRQAAIMLKAAAELGFTPTARARIEGADVPPQDPNEGDLDAFIDNYEG